MIGDITVFDNQSLGSGAFGSVFKGKLNGKLCAVKVLNSLGLEIKVSLSPQPNSVDPKTLERFERECKFLEQIKHDRVVRHFATRVHPSGLPVLVLELMECSLKQYLEQSTTLLPLNVQVSLCCDVASALAYLHAPSKNIVHRDICCENILLQLTDTPIPIAKVADFGMSRIIDHMTHSNSLTAMTHRSGLLPPEAPKYTTTKYGSSVDIFMFGAVMIQIVRKIRHIETAKQRSELLKRIPMEHPLKKTISKCLDSDMKKRPKATALHESLIKLQDQIKDNQRLVPNSGRVSMSSTLRELAASGNTGEMLSNGVSDLF